MEKKVTNAAPWLQIRVVLIDRKQTGESTQPTSQTNSRIHTFGITQCLPCPCHHPPGELPGTAQSTKSKLINKALPALSLPSSSRRTAWHGKTHKERAKGNSMLALSLPSSSRRAAWHGKRHRERGASQSKFQCLPCPWHNRLRILPGPDQIKSSQCWKVCHALSLSLPSLSRQISWPRHVSIKSRLPVLESLPCRHHRLGKCLAPTRLNQIKAPCAGKFATLLAIILVIV